MRNRDTAGGTVLARVVLASDRAFLVSFDDEPVLSAAGRSARRLALWLSNDPLPGVVDLIPAYATLLVRFDPLRGRIDSIRNELQARTSSVSERAEAPPRTFEVPVVYGGDSGPDLPLVAESTGLRESEVVSAHAAGEYDVRFIGFSPGFPYLGGLPDRLFTPRRPAPRRVVPAGSVAIAGAQAGIYPLRSPGGWNIIGRTDFVLFDSARNPMTTLAAGDRVRFVPVEPA